MSKFAAISAPALDTATLKVEAPNRVRIGGTITMQEPSRVIGTFFRSVHDAAMADALQTVELDVTELKFVNSSSIRLFLDWAGWLKNAPGTHYKLRILTTRKFTWQRTSFVAITSLAAGHVDVALAE